MDELLAAIAAGLSPPASASRGRARRRRCRGARRARDVVDADARPQHRHARRRDGRSRTCVTAYRDPIVEPRRPQRPSSWSRRRWRQPVERRAADRHAARRARLRSPAPRAGVASRADRDDGRSSPSVAAKRADDSARAPSIGVGMCDDGSERTCAWWRTVLPSRHRCSRSNKAAGHAPTSKRAGRSGSRARATTARHCAATERRPRAPAVASLPCATAVGRARIRSRATRRAEPKYPPPRATAVGNAARAAARTRGSAGSGSGASSCGNGFCEAGENHAVVRGRLLRNGCVGCVPRRVRQWLLRDRRGSRVVCERLLRDDR